MMNIREYMVTVFAGSGPKPYAATRKEGVRCSV